MRKNIWILISIIFMVVISSVVLLRNNISNKQLESIEDFSPPQGSIRAEKQCFAEGNGYLLLSATDDVDKEQQLHYRIKYSTEGNWGNWSDWKAFASNEPIPLKEYNDVYYLGVEFRDRAGHTSEMYTENVLVYPTDWVKPEDFECGR